MSESDEEEVLEDYFALKQVRWVNTIHEFREEEYEGESLLIARALQEIRKDPGSSIERAKIWRRKRQIRKFFQRDVLL